MLCQFGPVQFAVWPLNIHETRRESAYDAVEHAVIGGAMPVEPVGIGSDRVEMGGRLFPARLGGLPQFTVLRLTAERQIAMPLLRGDFLPLGWFLVTHLREGHTYLGERGVGQVVEFDATFLRTPAPSPAGFAASLVGLFS